VFDEKYLIVIVVVALLFGASRLPGVARNLGLGIKEFRHGLSDAIHDDDQGEASSPPPEERDPSS
jgi:TatA/E family protein of Tat protein translocase